MPGQNRRTRSTSVDVHRDDEPVVVRPSSRCKPRSRDSSSDMIQQEDGGDEPVCLSSRSKHRSRDSSVEADIKVSSLCRSLMLIYG